MTSRRFVIIGAGPAGCTAAILLHERGEHVILVDPLKRPGLIVGESLIPAIIPILRTLGVEETVRSHGLIKRGARISYEGYPEWVLSFSNTGIEECSYAYHIKRDVFDRILQERVHDLGIPLINDRIRISGKEEDLQWFSTESGLRQEAGDIVLDCSGRSRVLSRSLKLTAEEGLRDDRVLFCHQSHVSLKSDEYLHLDVCDEGWVWRIPLPGKTSIGGVYPKVWWDAGSKRKRLTSLLKASPLSQFIPRVDENCCIAEYSNYQRQSLVSSGAQWALLGDAYGFLDPVFSSGLYLAMQSASQFVRSLEESSTSWQEQYHHDVSALFSYWKEVIETFYNGQFRSLIITAHDLASIRDGGLPCAQEISRVLSGCGSDADLSAFRMALSMSMKHCESSRHVSGELT